jgi:hypothetical protein
MIVIRYAIWIDASGQYRGLNLAPVIGPSRFWLCNGNVMDPSDFKHAIIFPTRQDAENAITYGEGYAAFGSIVAIQCTVPDFYT